MGCHKQLGRSTRCIDTPLKRRAATIADMTEQISYRGLSPLTSARAGMTTANPLRDEPVSTYALAWSRDLADDQMLDDIDAGPRAAMPWYRRPPLIVGLAVAAVLLTAGALAYEMTAGRGAVPVPRPAGSLSVSTPSTARPPSSPAAAPTAISSPAPIESQLNSSPPTMTMAPPPTAVEAPPSAAAPPVAAPAAAAPDSPAPTASSASDPASSPGSAPSIPALPHDWPANLVPSPWSLIPTAVLPPDEAPHSGHRRPEH
jgi:hypothetical protein